MKKLSIFKKVALGLFATMAFSTASYANNGNGNGNGNGNENPTKGDSKVVLSSEEDAFFCEFYYLGERHTCYICNCAKFAASVIAAHNGDDDNGDDDNGGGNSDGPDSNHMSPSN